jgi:RNA polymerase sigma-70 factor (ECF subfamily)
MGEPLEFDDWYRTHAGRITAALVLLAGNPDLGRDAAADAFVKALERWGRVRVMAEPEGWVYRVGINALRRRQRCATTERRVSAQVRVRDSVPPVETDVDLLEAVAQLAERQREVIVLRYAFDLTQGEIAQRLAIAPGTVASTLTDARRQLAAQLGMVHEEVAP